MPTRVAWVDTAQSTLLIEYFDPITIDEIAAAQAETLALLDSVGHAVTTIFELRDVKHIPTDTLTNIPRLGRHPSIRHANNNATILVIEDIFIEQIAAIFGKLFHRHRVVRTLEEAYELAGAARVAKAS